MELILRDFLEISFHMHHMYNLRVCASGCFASQHGVNDDHVIGVSFSRHKPMFEPKEKCDYSDCSRLMTCWLKRVYY